MDVRVKLRATLLGTVEGKDLSETVTAATVRRSVAPDWMDVPSEADLPDVGDTVDTYRLVELLGTGMFGRVYVAERTDVPAHRVALKVINRAVYAGRNPERELVMLAAASHPNVVELKDHGIEPDYVWLTMPLYEGETLAERLEREPLGLEEAHGIFIAVARGLAALHEAGLRHQDIKPDNIFLARFAGQVHPVLLDLGVAVEKDAMVIAGTILFAAPEQVVALTGIGEPDALDESIDTYCLASTLLYALVGENHFAGVGSRSPLDMAKALERREQTPLDGGALPDLVGRPRELLAEAFCRWLSQSPAERPSASQLACELDVLLEQKRAQDRAIEESIARQKSSLQRFRLGAAAAVALLVVVGFLALSQRKTLHLAAKLRAAEQEGAATFEELGECRLAYNHEFAERRSCVATRERETATHEETVTSLQSNAQATQKDLSGKLTAAATQLTSCEENRQKLEDELGRKTTAWEEERSTLRSEIAEAEDERKICEEARTTCEDERASIQRERDTCKADLTSCKSDVYAAPAPSPPSPSVPSSAPPAGPATAGTATAAPPAPTPPSPADSIYD